MEFVGINNVLGCLRIYLNDLTLEIYSTGHVCYYRWNSVNLFKYNKKEENYDFFQYRKELKNIYKMKFGL